MPEYKTERERQKVCVSVRVHGETDKTNTKKVNEEERG